MADEEQDAAIPSSSAGGSNIPLQMLANETRDGGAPPTGEGPSASSLSETERGDRNVQDHGHDEDDVDAASMPDDSTNDDASARTARRRARARRRAKRRRRKLAAKRVIIATTITIQPLQCLPALTVTLPIDRLVLESCVDRNIQTRRSTILAGLLAAALAYVCLRMVTMHDLAVTDGPCVAFICLAVASAQFSLLKSPQPDAGSPTPGYNRHTAYTRAVMILLCGTSALVIDKIGRDLWSPHWTLSRSLEPTLTTLTDAFSGHDLNFGVAESSNGCFTLYGIPLCAVEILAWTRSFLVALVALLPVLAVMAWVPQPNTFVMVLLERVNISLLGGTAGLSFPSLLWDVCKGVAATLLLGLGLHLVFSSAPISALTTAFAKMSSSDLRNLLQSISGYNGLLTGTLPASLTYQSQLAIVHSLASDLGGGEVPSPLWSHVHILAAATRVASWNFSIVVGLVTALCVTLSQAVTGETSVLLSLWMRFLPNRCSWLVPQEPEEVREHAIAGQRFLFATLPMAVGGGLLACLVHGLSVVALVEPSVQAGTFFDHDIATPGDLLDGLRPFYAFWQAVLAFIAPTAVALGLAVHYLFPRLAAQTPGHVFADPFVHASDPGEDLEMLGEASDVTRWAEMDAVERALSLRTWYHSACTPNADTEGSSSDNPTHPVTESCVRAAPPPSPSAEEAAIEPVSAPQEVVTESESEEELFANDEEELEAALALSLEVLGHPEGQNSKAEASDPDQVPSPSADRHDADDGVTGDSTIVSDTEFNDDNGDDGVHRTPTPPVPSAVLPAPSTPPDLDDGGLTSGAIESGEDEDHHREGLHRFTSTPLPRSSLSHRSRNPPLDDGSIIVRLGHRRSSSSSGSSVAHRTARARLSQQASASMDVDTTHSVDEFDLSGIGIGTNISSEPVGGSSSQRVSGSQIPPHLDDAIVEEHHVLSSGASITCKESPRSARSHRLAPIAALPIAPRVPLTLNRAERVRMWCRQVERAVVHPLLFVSVITLCAPSIWTKGGASLGASWLVGWLSVLPVRAALQNETSVYLPTLGCLVVFTYGEMLGRSEGFLLNYVLMMFMVTILNEMRLKLNYVSTYSALWNVPWGSAVHAVITPLALPHTALLVLVTFVSSLISAPVFPIIGSTVFLPAYPRPIKFWERKYQTKRLDDSTARLGDSLSLGGPGGSQAGSAGNLNSVFYEHLTASLKTSLARDIELGRFGGECVEAGDFFLLVEDRLTALIHVVSKGPGWCAFQLRGMEFKGTYCQERELEAITQDVSEDAVEWGECDEETGGGCLGSLCDCESSRCCCGSARMTRGLASLPRLLRWDSMLSQRWMAWHTTALKYRVAAYDVMLNPASSMFELFTYRTVLLRNSALNSNFEQCGDGDYIDLDPAFSTNIDADYDSRGGGVSLSSFYAVYGRWMEECAQKSLQAMIGPLRRNAERRERRLLHLMAVRDARAQKQSSVSCLDTEEGVGASHGKPTAGHSAAEKVGRIPARRPVQVSDEGASRTVGQHSQKLIEKQQMRETPVLPTDPEMGSPSTVQRSVSLQQLSGPRSGITSDTSADTKVAPPKSPSSPPRKQPQAYLDASRAYEEYLSIAHREAEVDSAVEQRLIALLDWTELYAVTSAAPQPSHESECETASPSHSTYPPFGGVVDSDGTRGPPASSTRPMARAPWPTLMPHQRVQRARVNPFVRLCFAASLLARRGVARGGVYGSWEQAESFVNRYFAAFKGDIRVTDPRDEWVFTDVAILDILKSALRAGLKLHTDHFTDPAEYEDLNLLYAALARYEAELIVCHEGDPLWRQAILASRTRLLSLRTTTNAESETGPDHWVLQLSLKRLPFRVIKLNREMVRGLWAGQLHELVFCGNQNPERGSIQNMKAVLRNLVNQCCDLPVGYPIYVSPLTVSRVDVPHASAERVPLDVMATHRQQTVPPGSASLSAPSRFPIVGSPSSAQRDECRPSPQHNDSDAYEPPHAGDDVGSVKDASTAHLEEGTQGHDMMLPTPIAEPQCPLVFYGIWWGLLCVVGQILWTCLKAVGRGCCGPRRRTHKAQSASRTRDFAP